MARQAHALGYTLVALAAPEAQEWALFQPHPPAPAHQGTGGPPPLGERGACLRSQGQSPPGDSVTHAATPTLPYGPPTLTEKFLGRHEGCWRPLRYSLALAKTR